MSLIQKLTSLPDCVRSKKFYTVCSWLRSFLTVTMGQCFETFFIRH